MCKNTCGTCFNNEGNLCYCSPPEDDMDEEQIHVNNDRSACSGWKPKD